MLCHSLRGRVTQKVSKVMQKRRDPRVVSIPLAAIFGLLPIFVYHLGLANGVSILRWNVSTLASDVLSWIEIAWGGAATLFALSVSICALITGISSSGGGRRQLFSKFRKSAFDPVVVLGLTFLADTSWIISFAIITQAGVSKLEVMLWTILVCETVLVSSIGFLVFNTVHILSTATESALRQERLLENTYETIYGLAVEQCSLNELKMWGTKNKVMISPPLPIDSFSGCKVRNKTERMVEDVNLRLLTKWASFQTTLSDRSDSVAILNIGLGKWLMENQTLAVVREHDTLQNEYFFGCLKFKKQEERVGVPELIEELTATLLYGKT